MMVANAQFAAFDAVCDYVARLVPFGLLTVQSAADLLHEVARYNRLDFLYGNDAVQALTAAAFEREAA